MSSIAELWTRLETWLTAHAPEIAGSLNDGASHDQLTKLAAEIGVTLPPDVIEFYQAHDGQDDEAPWLFDATEFLATDRILDEWGVWKDLCDSGDFEGCETSHPPEICSDWFSTKWMPLTYNGAGDHHCIDFAPGKGGTVGQVIEMWHDDDQRSLLASSITEWFTEFVTAVENGEYELSDEYGGLSRKD